MQTIFISSTFQDMQQERDLIQSEVLPRLQEFARQYGESVEICDLRWGIDTSKMSEAESTAKILQVCFDEIDSSRPFFIGLLGGRYGWVPDPSLVSDIAACQGDRLGDLRGKSVTEMEILYGAFREGAPGAQCRFYFRTIENDRPRFFSKSPVPALYTSDNSADRRRMQALKDKISQSRPEWVRSYSVVWDQGSQSLRGMERFSQMVYEDLRAMLAERFGGQKPSGFELEKRQQRFTLESEAFFRGEPIAVDLPNGPAGRLLEGTWAEDKQNLFLVSRDGFNLGRLASSLGLRLQDMGWRVIPYSCGQSPSSSTVEGLVSYLLSSCRELLGEDTGAGGSLAEKLAELPGALKRLDGTGRTLILVRGLDKLAERDNLSWLPSVKLENVRFMVSSNCAPVGPKGFQDMTEVYYFESGQVFRRSEWVDAYLKRYHKELDSAAKAALLKLTEGKHDRYLEFLIQRLLVLDQGDYDEIRRAGGGIPAISAYLCKLLSRQPDNLEDMVLQTVGRLEGSVGGEFTHAMIGMLLALPYGFPESLLRELESARHIGYSHLALSEFCRAMSSLVGQTLDGYLRCADSPVLQILRRQEIADLHRWSGVLEGYMASLMAGRLGPVQERMILDQYPYIAFEADVHGALGQYITLFRGEARTVAAVLRGLLSRAGGAAWLGEELGCLDGDGLDVLLKDIYPQFKENGWIDRELLPLWAQLDSAAGERARGSTEHAALERAFFAAFQCGEIARTSESGQAEEYLLRAKDIAKADFSANRNHLWRRLNGLPPTPEDEALLKSMPEGLQDSGLTLGFGSEMVDMLAEHSWSPYVRVIYSYLTYIYSSLGDTAKAEQMREEERRLTHMMDPDPGDTGDVQLAPGIRVIRPSVSSDGPEVKHSYKPDLRRNTAISLSKAAISAKKSGDMAAAKEKYNESCEILLDIYRDGADGKYYDMSGVLGDVNEQRERIRSECLRDLALNYEGMLGCMLQDDPGEIGQCAENMLKYGLEFDRQRNSAESKSDLVQYYGTACCIFNDYPAISSPGKVLDSCRELFRSFEEACAKGWRPDDRSVELRDNGGAVLYQCVSGTPSLGGEVVDIILDASNRSAMHGDFNGFCFYTEILSSLAELMWDGGYNWRGSKVSLEDLYVRKIVNLCGLWRKNRMWQRFGEDAGRLAKQLSRFTDTSVRSEAALAVSQFGLYLYSEGRYVEAADIFELIMKSLSTEKGFICRGAVWVEHQARYVAALSESGRLEEAGREAERIEDVIGKLLDLGWSPEDGAVGISRNQFELVLKREMATALLNHAVILSRMERDEEARSRLSQAHSWALEHPEVQAANPDILTRIEFYMSNGLPKSKEIRDGEILYRRCLGEAEDIIAQCAHGAPTRELAEELRGKVEQMEAQPEHKIFFSCQQMAFLYHRLFQIYSAVRDRAGGMQALSRACWYARQDTQTCGLYGDIFSDMAAVCGDSSHGLEYINEAIGIYDTLRKSGGEYSESSLAMAYYNRGLLMANRKNYRKAEEDVERAVLIFRNLTRETNVPPETASFLQEAERLSSYIRRILGTK